MGQDGDTPEPNVATPGNQSTDDNPMTQPSAPEPARVKRVYMEGGCSLGQENLFRQRRYFWVYCFVFTELGLGEGVSGQRHRCSSAHAMAWSDIKQFVNLSVGSFCPEVHSEGDMDIMQITYVFHLSWRQ